MNNSSCDGVTISTIEQAVILRPRVLPSAGHIILAPMGCQIPCL
ncbi:hypothetical protein [Sulfitobacter marinus]|nr:hypothetical protein [Sulfitobacter marinus]